MSLTTLSEVEMLLSLCITQNTLSFSISSQPERLLAPARPPYPPRLHV